MSTTVSIVGTIGTSPRLSRSASNTAFCTFRLASTPRRYDRASGEWGNGETSWYSVTAFRGLAEHAQASLKIGDRVVVAGRLSVRQWQKEDRSGTNAEIEADALGHDLRWGTTAFTADHSGADAQVTPAATPGTDLAGSDPAGSDSESRPESDSNSELDAAQTSLGTAPAEARPFVPSTANQDPELMGGFGDSTPLTQLDAA